MQRFKQCLKCKNRFPGCHDVCKSYQAERYGLDERNAAIRVKKSKHDEFMRVMGLPHSERMHRR